jgi:hypothetical protein
VPAELALAVQRRRPGLDPAVLAPVGWPALVEMVGEYVDAGLSKFVVRPAALGPEDGALDRFVAEFVEHMTPLQT